MGRSRVQLHMAPSGSCGASRPRVQGKDLEEHAQRASLPHFKSEGASFTLEYFADACGASRPHCQEKTLKRMPRCPPYPLTAVNRFPKGSSNGLLHRSLADGSFRFLRSHSPACSGKDLPKRPRYPISKVMGRHSYLSTLADACGAIRLLG